MLTDLVGYISLKLTGTIAFTLTLFPSCFPGFHLGIFLAACIAALSRSGCTPRAILKSVNEPSLWTMKAT